MSTRTRMNVYFDQKLLEQVEMLALRRQVSKSAIIEAAVASFLSGDAADRLEAAMSRRLAPEDFFMSLGHTTRQNAEFVVLGRRGKPRRNSRSIRQLIIEPKREHSRKPESFYPAAEAYAGPLARRLELFPRTRRPGWEAWGDQIDHFNLEDDNRGRKAA